MNEKPKCILCEKDVRVSKVSGKSASFVECNTCGNYEFDHFFEKAYVYMPREKRAMLSAYSRNRFERGEKPPELGDDDLLKDIITEYENKTLDEKLKNLILYIRKKSHQFGDSVLLEAKKDYPIMYSLSSEGFTEILNIAIAKKLIESTESGFKLTEEGWKMSTELMKSS